MIVYKKRFVSFTSRERASERERERASERARERESERGRRGVVQVGRPVTAERNGGELTSLRCSATSARIWSLYGKLFGMPGSFLRSSAKMSTTDTHRRHKGHGMHALLFHCGFFFASLAFFLRDSLALCLNFSRWWIATRLLVSAQTRRRSSQPILSCAARGSAEEGDHAYSYVSGACRE